MLFLLFVYKFDILSKILLLLFCNLIKNVYIDIYNNIITAVMKYHRVFLSATKIIVRKQINVNGRNVTLQSIYTIHILTQYNNIVYKYLYIGVQQSTSQQKYLRQHSIYDVLVLQNFIIYNEYYYSCINTRYVLSNFSVFRYGKVDIEIIITLERLE